MAGTVTNYPGPFEIRIIYSVAVAGFSAFEHIMRLNCDVAGVPDPGEDPSTILITRRVASLDPADDMMDAIVDEWIALITPYWSNACTFIRAELWSYEEESFDAAFVTSYTIGTVGSSATAIVPAAEVIHTYRTIEGGVMRLHFEEPSVAAGAKSSLATATGVTGAIKDFIISTANWILARDTSYPFAPMFYHPGQNERTFKKRYRP